MLAPRAWVWEGLGPQGLRGFRALGINGLGFRRLGVRGSRLKV